MKVKFLKQCLVGGKTCKKDSTRDLNKKDAQYLVAIGKAAYTEKPGADK